MWSLIVIFLGHNLMSLSLKVQNKSITVQIPFALCYMIVPFSDYITYNGDRTSLTMVVSKL